MLECDEDHEGVVAAEVLMLRAAAKKAILIVEGGTDERIFRQFVDEAQCDIVIARGRKNALDAMEILEARGVDGIVCIVDVDYDRFCNRDVSTDNIVVTDENDIEIVMIKSSAFERVLAELSSIGKMGGKSVDDVRAAIMNAAFPIGCLRRYSHVSGAGLKFQDMQYRFVSREMETDEQALAQYIKGRSDTTLSVEELAEAIKAAEEVGPDRWAVCSGHDLCAMLGKSLQFLFGSQRGSDVDQDKIERHLRLAYDARCFSRSAVHAGLIAWEGRNVPFRCLQALA